MADMLLFVPTITCGHCKDTIESALGSVEGVARVDVAIDQRVVRVARDGATADAVVRAIERAGYRVASHTG